MLPENVEQIKQILKICKANNTPMVTRGAGTGLAGGAMPLENSVVLGLSKLNQVKSIDVKNRLAVVENSGGVHCLKYGLTMHNVEAIKMLTIDGDELILFRQDDGLGLLALMNGSEGLLKLVIR